MEEMQLTLTLIIIQEEAVEPAELAKQDQVLEPEAAQDHHPLLLMEQLVQEAGAVLLNEMEAAEVNQCRTLVAALEVAEKVELVAQTIPLKPMAKLILVVAADVIFLVAHQVMEDRELY